MRKAADLVLILAFVALLGAPLANMLHPFVTQRRLEGAVMEKARPAIATAPLVDETFQHAFTGWFEQAYGARSFLVRLDNSIDYLAFQETRPDKSVKIGHDRVLFHGDQIAHLNTRSIGADLTRYAKRIRAARDVLRTRGIFLEFIVIPAKTTIWRDAFPGRWTLPVGNPRPSDESDASFRGAVAAAGVPIVDGNALLEPLGRNDRTAVYARSARHATRPATCLMLDAALDRVRPELQGSTLPPLDCSFSVVTPDFVTDIDFDLHRLMNLWVGPPTTETILGPSPPETVPTSSLPPAMIVGSSFGWQFVGEADRNRLFRSLHFHYYGTTMIDWTGDRGRAYPVGLGSDEWRTLLLSKQIVLFVVPEEYLADDKAEFFVETIRAFGPNDPETLGLLR